jgi:hypothetical protein
MKFSNSIETVRTELLQHDLYKILDSSEKVRVFMENHVFAVWDFMSLLKRLQRDLTCVEIPWRRKLSDEQTKYARFINEMVIGEETDEDGNGGFISHFGLYLEAMKESGADTEKIERFLDALDENNSLNDALKFANVAPEIAEFVEKTIEIAENGKTHEVCAAFFYGREEIIPEMFQVILDETQNQSSSKLKYYLARHIEIDGEEHSILAAELLKFLCEGKEIKIAEAEKTAVECLNARISLWDGICRELSKENNFKAGA